MPDKKAIIFKVQNLSGRHGRRCGGISVKVGAPYPGRSVDLPGATDIERCWEGSAEVSRGHSVRWTALKSGGLKSLWLSRMRGAISKSGGNASLAGEGE